VEVMESQVLVRGGVEREKKGVMQPQIEAKER
jgi:hypothetical protein